MATRDIRTAHVHVACDVCGRTLLRGERADTFLQGGTRRAVCELCAPRALREGWVREGNALEAEPPEARSERRRGLLDRLRGRREDEEGAGALPPADGYDAAWEGAPGLETGPPATPGAAAAEAEALSGVSPAEPTPEAPEARPPTPPTPTAPSRAGRAVRAVPMGPQQRVSAAIECFNAGEHPRTIAGVARSLGPPEVSVRALDGPAAEVAIVVAWELSWYRYEVLLGDDEPTVRVAAKGYELDELAAEDRRANAAADEHGRLSAV